jgi:hypothetical protein
MNADFRERNRRRFHAPSDHLSVGLSGNEKNLCFGMFHLRLSASICGSNCIVTGETATGQPHSTLTAMPTQTSLAR